MNDYTKLNNYTKLNDYTKLPPELTSLPRWCVWVLTSSGQKLPLKIDGSGGASSKDRTHFGSFEHALALYNTGQYKGLGFAFFPEDGLVGIDYDDVRDADDGKVQEWAALEIRSLSTYTEISPSGTGFKQFGIGKLPGKEHTKPGSQTEMYDGSDTRPRFFTVTGLHLDTSPLHVQDISGPLKDAYARMEAFDLVEAFRRRGWLTGSERGDKIGIRCPWESEHSRPQDTTALFRNAKRGGGYSFKCLHSHCQDRTVEDVYKFLGYKEPENKAIVGAIIIRGGQLSSIVDEAEDSLLKGTVTLYQRGGTLVRAIKLDQVKSTDPIRRAPGSTVLTQVQEAWLIEQMGKSSDWKKWSEKERDYVKVDPPKLYAETLLSRKEWRFPVLRGITTAPTLTKDGRVLETPGYDEDTGLFLDFLPGAFPLLGPPPDKDKAHRALEFFKGPLREFCFVEGARSVALSALLTGLIRLSMRTSPLHAFDAPVAGSGKSLLAEMVGILTTGLRPPALSQGKTPEEDEKRLSTVLFAGDPIIHIDNCDRPLSGDFLCSMLTQELLQARILGLSERRILPSTALVLASGNNLSYAGDVSRRVVPCRLDPQTEHPEQREHTFDCHEEVLQLRPRLVAAGLTMLRAYILAGKPDKPRTQGSFADWDVVRGTLLWLGEGDPADACKSVLENDPRRDELGTVMNLWMKAYGNSRITTNMINSQAEDDRAAHRETIQVALRDKLIEVSCRGTGWNGKSVGWWLKRHKDRILGGMCFRCEASGYGQQMWSLMGSTTLADMMETGLGAEGEVVM